MHRPMTRMSPPMIGQPHAMAAGPPPFQPAKNVVKQPARIEMIENEIAKFEKPDQLRFSSCLYPSSASRFSSSSSCMVVATAFSPRFQVGCCASLTRRPNSWLSNVSTARSYFSMPHDQKSNSALLTASWIDAQSVHAY